jgi:fructose-1,6-bisphosphatase I
MAGGESIDGTGRLMELPHANTHDTSPCFFGSKFEIARVKDVYSREG